jgi:hypothetical protein
MAMRRITCLPISLSAKNTNQLRASSFSLLLLAVTGGITGRVTLVEFLFEASANQLAIGDGFSFLAPGVQRFMSCLSG